MPTGKLVARNPVRLVELHPRDEKPRTRIASVIVAGRLLAVLRPDDAVPYAIAMYAGLRRQEIQRLRWEDLDLGRHWLTVREAKTEAGTGRRVPLAEPLEQILLASADRPGSAPRARVARVSVMSGKLAERATAAWTEAGLRRMPLHECRHTFASMLMAAGCTIKEIMVFMGHADLQTVQRYIKLLPQRDERSPIDRLDNYLRPPSLYLLRVAVAAAPRLALHRARPDWLRRGRGWSGGGL